MSALAEASAKIPLPTFLKALTSNGVPAAKAMQAAGKIYKQYNTRAALSFLTDFDLEKAGVAEKDLRKQIIMALKKAGYKGNATAGKSKAGPSKQNSASNKTNPDPNAPQTQTARRKRKRDDDLNELLPDRPIDEGESLGNLDFNEVLNEETLMSKSVVINRAPIMAAWSFIVAERLGFQREEALSIASVYTEMNAISKGVSLGIYDQSKKKGIEASKDGSQPYVDLMGRRPLFQTATQQWRALSSGSPVSPSAAYTYIKRSLRQTTPFIIGAMRVLASTYTPKDLNFKGFSLYADFRPEVNEWGKRGEVRCQTILDLRNMVLEVGEMKGDVIGSSSGGGGPPDGGETIVVSTSRLDVVKVGKLDEMDGDVHDKIEGKGKEKDSSFEQASLDEVRTEPDQKKVKIGVDEPADEDEYDAAFDDLGDIDLQHLP